MAEREYKTYEDLVEPPKAGGFGGKDFAHGQMFKLPDWVQWWTAREAWGKPTKMDDPKEHTVDVRFVGFLIDQPDCWVTDMRRRVGGLAYSFMFAHHRDANRDRHLCVKTFGHECPRCESFFKTREETAHLSQEEGWEKIKVFSQQFSSLMFGYVGGDYKTLRAFEFSDTRPGKAPQKEPTIFQRITRLCTDKQVPTAMQLDKLFYAYDPARSQVVRLKYDWVVPKQKMGNWHLTDIYKVTEADGAPSPVVPDPSVAERIRPWDWLDIEGERQRMSESDGADAGSDNKPDFDNMDYPTLIAYAVENGLNKVLAMGFEADETSALRSTIKKEVNK